MPEGTEVKVDTQFSESGGGFREMSGYRTYVIPVEPETAYKFNIANIASSNLNGDIATIYELTADQVFNSRINGSKYIYSMTDTIISEDCTSAEINFVTTSNARYIAVSIVLGSVNPDDIRITLNISIALPVGTELYLNQRYSYSEAQLVGENGMFAVFIPVDEYAGKASVIRIKNSSIPLNVKPETGNNHVIYALKSDKTNLGHINGAIIPDMSSDYITYSADYKSADICVSIPSNCGYLAISLRVIDALTTIDDNDIKDYIIEIDTQSSEVPEEVLNHTNLVPTSVDVDGTVYNSVGYKNNTYITTDGNIPIDTTYELVTTGLIEHPENYILYVYGATFNTENSYCRIAAYNESKECVQVWTGGGTSINVIDMGNGIQKIELVSSTLNSYPYVRFSFEGVGDNLYIYNIADETIFDEIILEQGDITDSVTWTMDKRLSSAGDSDKDAEGTMASDYILVNPGDVINIYGIASLSAAALYINLYKDEAFVTNIPLSNADRNPTDNGYAYAEYDSITTHLTIQIKDGQPVNSLRVCCVASTVTVYRNAEREELDPIVLPAGSELYLNQRFSQSGGGLVDNQGYFTVFIPIDGTIAYTLSMSNMPCANLNNTSTTLYKLNETKTVGTVFNGANNPSAMTTGVTMSEDCRSAIIDVPAGDATVHYVALAYPVDTNLQLTESHLAGIVITLEESNQ